MPLAVEKYETVRSLAVRPDRVGFVLGTRFWVPNRVAGIAVVVFRFGVFHEVEEEARHLHLLFQGY